MIPWFGVYVSIILFLAIMTTRHTYVEYYDMLRIPKCEGASCEVYWWDTTLHNKRLRNEGRI